MNDFLEREPVAPRSFYNPFIASARGRDRQQIRSQQHIPKHTYVSVIDEFKFVAPKSLDVNLEDEASGSDDDLYTTQTWQKGTHVGVLRRHPVVYYRGESVEFLNFASSAGKLWPTRTSIWEGKWFGPANFDPRFSRFHVYDIVEGQETVATAEERTDAARFMRLVDPVGTVVTLLGMTECGKRVAVHVYGERPYFYMRKSDTDAACGSRCPSDLVEKLVECLRKTANDEWPGKSWRGGATTKHAHAGCFDVDVVSRRDIYYYGTPSEAFYRIKAASSRYVNSLCDNFCPTVTKYEGQVDVVTRFVLDHPGFVSFGWYRVTNGQSGEKVQVRKHAHHSTSCDVEINCTADNLICEQDDAEWQ